MYTRKTDLMNATENQLRAWLRMLPPGTDDSYELEDELLYRRYAKMYGNGNAHDMMTALINVREKYNKKMA